MAYCKQFVYRPTHFRRRVPPYNTKIAWSLKSKLLVGLPSDSKQISECCRTSVRSYISKIELFRIRTGKEWPLTIAEKN